MKWTKTIILAVCLCLFCSQSIQAQALVVNEKNNTYEFQYHFKAKKTAKLERLLNKKLGTPVKMKTGKKIVWKNENTKVKLKKGKLKLKHKGNDVMKWKLLNTRIKLIL